MPVYQFGPWLPDQAAYNNRGVTVAENVVPSASGYLPVAGLEPATSALDSRPLGALRTRDTDGNVAEFAGDAGKLYQLSGDTWGDVSKTGGYTSAERWEFVTWNDKVLATNYEDDPQQITFGASNFSDLTTDLRGAHLAVVRDFVVLANTFDTTDGAVPSRVRWSAFGDETDWTVSTSTLAGFQDLKTAAVNRVFGGEYGVIFQTDAVWRMTFVGSPVGFQFDEALPGVGLYASGAAAQDGNTVYFLSPRGFFALTNGTQANAIGANRVDQYILDDLDTDYLERISAAIEPGSHRVLWAYPGQGNVEGRPNRIAVYDPSLDRWSLIQQDVELLWQSGGTGTTMDSLDSITGNLDELEISLDSKQWSGSGRLLGAFDSDYKHGHFSGPPMAATIETREYEIHGGARTRLNAFRALVEGDVTAQVGTRNDQAEDVTFGAVLTPRANGRITTRSNARYHRFRLNISGLWERAIGIQIEPDEARRGGRRG